MSMIIQLLHDYGGARTRERRIAPGFYAVDDPALFGLADYLVENGHAVVASITTNTVTEISREVLPPDVPKLPDYEALTVEELRAECARREIDLDAIRGTGKDGNLLKADLVFILRGDDEDMQTLHFEGRLIHAASGEE